MFEFMFDYVVVKILCWFFDKFVWVDCCLGIQMKVIGEVMVLGCIIEEFLFKVVCFLEIGVDYLVLCEVVDLFDDIFEEWLLYVCDDCLFCLIEVI